MSEVMSQMSEPRVSSIYSSHDLQDSGAATPRSTSRGRSFSFLRRQSSKDGIVRSTSLGRKLIRRKSSKGQEPAESLPPRLPSMILPHSASFPSTASDFSPNPQPYQNFNYSRSAISPHQRRQMETSYYRDLPVPGIPGASLPTTRSHDPHARSESMTNRGRYSYASASTVQHSDSPRRTRRRKDPTPFNVLVIGTKGSGKTSFIDFLRTALAAPVKRRPNTPSPESTPTNSTSNGFFTSHYLETELEGERVGLTLYDSKGLERHLVDLQLREMSSFLESKFQETFNEEQKVMRATGVRDTHIHCVLLILDPARLDANTTASKSATSHDAKENDFSAKPRLIGGLDEALDIGPIRALEGKSTVIPIISKADTITTAHMAHLKRTVWDSFKKIKFDPLEALDTDQDENVIEEADESDETDADSAILQETPSMTTPKPETTRSTEQSGNTKANKIHPEALGALSPPQVTSNRFSAMSLNVDLPYLPMSIISPDEYDPGVVGRRFPWGFADPYNAEHCDFVRLKETVFSEWRAELRDVSRERWYEGWRTTRLKKRGPSPSVVSAAPPASNMVNARRTLSPPAGQRAVSSAAAYGSLESRQVSSTANMPSRAMSTNEIGVAIGSDTPAEHANGMGIAY